LSFDPDEFGMTTNPFERSSVFASLFNRTPISPNPLSGLEFLATPLNPPRNELAHLLSMQSEPNGLGALGNRFSPDASSSLAPRSALADVLAGYTTPLPKPQPIKRRVFFSFHYQEDINRANIVRKSWVVRPGDKNQPAEFFDHSLWESKKRAGDEALKNFIREGMENSSVTCVLAGQQTWARPWVRYEIARSLVRENGLLTVYIDGLKCMRAGLGTRGPNPLDYMGVYWADDAKAYIAENFNGSWRPYPLYTAPITWPRHLTNATARKAVQPLSLSAMQYDYAAQDGYSNLSGWAQLAADLAGR
jgi:hypothetical protein